MERERRFCSLLTIKLFPLFGFLWFYCPALFFSQLWMQVVARIHIHGWVFIFALNSTAWLRFNIWCIHLTDYAEREKSTLRNCVKRVIKHKAAWEQKPNILKISQNHRYGPLNQKASAMKVQVISMLVSWGWIFPLKQTLQQFLDKLRQMFEIYRTPDRFVFSSVWASCWVVYWNPFLFLCIQTSMKHDVSHHRSVLQTFFFNLHSRFILLLLGGWWYFSQNFTLFTLF